MPKHVYHSGFGQDTITNFTASGPARDTLQFDKNIFADFVNLMQSAAQQGADVMITQDAANTITVKNTTLASLSTTNTQFV
jgi:hypothetical protein